MMIGKTFKQEYIVLDELKARECGKWNGLTFSQILEKYPEGLAKILSEPDKTTEAGAESSIEFITRVKKVIDKLVEKNLGNRIIIVTHPEVIQAAICAALEIPADKLPKIFIRTGSVTQISYFEEWSSLVYSDYVPLR
jgi:broad specificity phosphatase PhoE